jgi:hypothetical protein
MNRKSGENYRHGCQLTQCLTGIQEDGKQIKGGGDASQSKSL